MTTVPSTNVVSPKITCANDVWFDPRAGLDDPTFIKGPYEGTVNPQEVVLSLDQTNDVNGHRYLSDATLTLSSDGVELYRADTLAENSKLVFCENKARIPNADLKTPLTLYAKGVKAGQVTLKLALDLLETSEWKKTNFTTGVKENLVNVDNSAPAGTVVVMVKAAETASPVIQAGQADCRARPSGSPLPLVFSFVKVGNVNAYNGGGELTLIPENAKIALYKTDQCQDVDKLVFASGVLAIPNGDLKDGGITYYARATANDVTGDAKLKLTLKPNSDSKTVVACGPAMRVVALAQVNTVTPQIATLLDPSHDGALWYPALARGIVPSMTLGIGQNNEGVDYNGDGLLTCSDDNVELYTDKALTKPLSLQNKQAIIPNVDLKDTDKVYYLKGGGTGTTTLSLSLYNPLRPSIVIGDTATTDIDVKQVTQVQSHVNWLSSEVQFGGEASLVNIYATQTTSGGGDYEKVATLNRSHAELAVLDGTGTQVFSGTNLSADIVNDKLMTPQKAYTATWTGGQAPDGGTARLTLALQPSAKPYIITDPATELMAPGVVVPIQVAVKPINTVTPKIQTDYDLVMLDRSFTDGQADDRTAPTLARIYVCQSSPLIGFDGNGTLTRENDSIQIYRDAQLTDEISFYGDQALIPNSVLKDKTKTYYIKGAKAGKTGLTLKLDGPNSVFVGLPNFEVAADAKKELTVTKLALELYRDDASGSQSAPVALTTSVEMAMRTKRLTGRFVPLQNIAKQFGRAKLVVKKVETVDWPTGADNHIVTLNVSSDIARIYDAAINGTVVATKDAPLQLKKADLSADKIYWIESFGLNVSAALRDEVFMLGLDRTDKDTAHYPDAPDSILAKANGDWSCATVMTLTAVTPNIADWKQFVNQPPDHTLTHNTNQNQAKNGRSIVVTATVLPAVAGVGVDVMLWADGANAADIPAGLKSMATDTHVPAVTDNTGKANARLKLSRYGGDKFTAVAFLADDAAKGAATFGANAGATPTEFKSNPVTVWRKLAYDLIYMNRHGNANYGGDYSDKFNQGNFEAAFSTSFLELETENTNVVANVPALYAGALSPGGGTRYNNWLTAEKGLHNIQDPKDRAFTLMFVETTADGSNNWTQWFSKPTVAGNVFRAGINNRLFDLSAKNRYFLAGSCSVAAYSLGFIPRWTEAVPDANVSVVDGNNGQYELQVDLTGVNLHSWAIRDLWIQVTLYSLDYFCGMSLGRQPYTFTAVRYAEQRGANVGDEVYSTAVHEVGHFLGLAPKTLPSAAATGNTLWYLGDGGNRTSYYDRNNVGQPTAVVQYNRSYGQGPHCMDGYTNFRDLRNNHGSAAKVDCLMFDSTVRPPITRVCPVCLGSVKAREYALSNTDDDAAY